VLEMMEDIGSKHDFEILYWGFALLLPSCLRIPRILNLQDDSRLIRCLPGMYGPDHTKFEGNRGS
jgi:hypothetical protein